MMTGVIFAAIAVLWVGYLVPWTSRTEKISAIGLDEESIHSFDRSARVIRDCGFKVSTPLTRRAVRYDIWRANKVANRRRRGGLLLNFLILVATIVLPLVLPVSSWLSVAGGAFFIIWLLISRMSVVTMRRAAKRWLEDSALANDTEDTVVIDLPRQQVQTELTLDDRSVELSLTDTIGSLMEPLPVTPITYVSKPLLPRSVRTIDLSSPMFEARPVLANRQDGEETVVQQLPRAVGE